MEQEKNNSKQNLSDLLTSITQDLSFIKNTIGELESIKSEVDSLKNKTEKPEEKEEEKEGIKEETKEEKVVEDNNNDLELSEKEIEELDKFFNEY